MVKKRSDCISCLVSGSKLQESRGKGRRASNRLENADQLVGGIA